MVKPVGIAKYFQSLHGIRKGKVIEVVCPYCNHILNPKIVAMDYNGDDKIERVCSNQICQRTYEWALTNRSKQIGAAIQAGVGELFIRDDQLPSLVCFSPSDKIMWPKSSYICGPSGTGKTWGLCAIVCEALSHGRVVRIINCQRLQLVLRATYKSEKETELDVLRYYESVNVLCLDDLGSGKQIGGKESEAARVFLYMLIDARHNRKRTTHISSNLKLTELATVYDERIARRIREMCEIVVLKEVI